MDAKCTTSLLLVLVTLGLKLPPQQRGAAPA